eukprot:Amastigsp_a175006_1237.p2 type:complete len:172 gc:universal Amastigsp_a175006_1237:10-525(+)
MTKVYTTASSAHHLSFLAAPLSVSHSSRHFLTRFPRPRNAAARVPAGAGALLDDADVDGLLALGASGDLELDLLALDEGALAVVGALDRGEVRKDIGARSVLQEAVALARVEPLDGACKNCVLLCRRVAHPTGDNRRRRSEPCDRGDGCGRRCGGAGNNNRAGNREHDERA